MHVNVQGIKCDNPECDYKDLDIIIPDYSVYIGKPCPECGESLMTQEILDEVNGFEEMIDKIAEYQEDHVKLFQYVQTLTPKQMEQLTAMQIILQEELEKNPNLTADDIANIHFDVYPEVKRKVD